MSQSGCGSGSGIGGHHGGNFSFFGTVGHQSSRSSKASPLSRPNRSVSQMVWANSEAIAAPNSWGGSGWGLRATSEKLFCKKRTCGPWGMMSKMAGNRRPMMASSLLLIGIICTPNEAALMAMPQRPLMFRSPNRRSLLRQLENIGSYAQGL
ncbi:MAG: hypothetical protein ABL884_05390 [Methyloglobulus sp.]